MRRPSVIVVVVALAVATLAVAAVVAVRASSDDGDDGLEAWAGAVCSSVADWRTAIRELTDVTGAELDAETLRQRVDEAESETEDLVSELRELGPPDVESGDALQAELEAALTRLRTEYDALRDEAEDALDTPSPAAFLQALTSFAPRFQSLLREAENLLETITRAPQVAAETREELRRALERSEECDELRGSG